MSFRWSTGRKSRRIWLFAAVLAVCLSSVLALQADAQAGGNPIRVYLFWGDGCPHCAEEKPFLDQLARDNPSVEIRSYEVWNDQENLSLALQMADKFGFEASGVPITFVGSRHWIGFSDVIGEEIRAAVDACQAEGCADAGAGVMPGAFEDSEPVVPVEEAVSGIINVPIIGRVDLNKQGLVLSTALIAFVDGFNPCSLWVLSMLLALVLHTGSRKKIFLIGIIFLTVTALIYALFIAGLFSVLKIVSFVGWIQVGVAVIALVFALVNIKDYFWYKEGLSFTIADEKKPGLYKKMRNVLNSSNSIAGLVASTIALAVGVSLVEFSCTAGFPVLWTNILTAHDVSPLTFITLLVFYMLIYQLDELVIFSSAVFSLKASRLEEKHGRILKLIGGTLMLTLAGVMLINPDLLNNLASSLIIFAIAFGLAGLVLLVHRVLMPSMGIKFGTEQVKPTRRRRARVK